MNGGMDEWVSPVHPVYFTNFQMNTTEVDISNLHANDNDILEYSGKFYGLWIMDARYGHNLTEGVGVFLQHSNIFFFDCIAIF